MAKIEPTTIYRVEADDGGAYQCDRITRTFLQKTFGTNSTTALRPCASEDAVLAYAFGNSFGAMFPKPGSRVANWPHVRYGFGDLDQLRRWFPEDARWSYVQKDFYIGVYQAMDALIGETQAVFNPATAVRIGKLDLITFQPLEPMASTVPPISPVQLSLPF